MVESTLFNELIGIIGLGFVVWFFFKSLKQFRQKRKNEKRKG